MNREIKFRGRRTDNGEWVYGLPIYLNIDTVDTLCIATNSLSANNYGEIYHYDYDIVDESTVGQFTGLYDKNGKEIYEGDIVRCVATYDTGNCVVIFEDGEFRLVPDKYYHTYITGGGFHAIRCFDKEVIGNIHDAQLKG